MSADKNGGAAAATQGHSAPSKTESAGNAYGESLKASIDNFDFTPKELNVKQGSTVTWTNHDDTPHTVTSDDGAFGSSLIGQAFGLRFEMAAASRTTASCTRP